MNLAIRGVECDLGKEPADSFHKDQHPDLKADYVLANPPFNMSDWGGDLLQEDKRWKYGTPPTGNANFAWVQHFIHHLSPSGMASFVLANGSMSSNTSREGEIRKAIIEADLVDCMVALPGQLFYSTQIPVCLCEGCGGKTMSPQLLEETFLRIDFDRELTFKFFVVFSLFEHAIKKAGFRNIGKNDSVEPDWDSFSRSINGQFNPNLNPELSNAVNYLLDNPTKKQVFRNNHLTFIQTKRPKISDTEWLSLLIRRVRNNLFHGGKVNYDRHRDTLLIQFSIIILESWAILNPDVMQEIHNVR
jgi:hypothetical protein